VLARILIMKKGIISLVTLAIILIIGASITVTTVVLTSEGGLIGKSTEVYSQPDIADEDIHQHIQDVVDQYYPDSIQNTQTEEINNEPHKYKSVTSAQETLDSFEKLGAETYTSDGDYSKCVRETMDYNLNIRQARNWQCIYETAIDFDACNDLPNVFEGTTQNSIDRCIVTVALKSDSSICIQLPSHLISECYRMFAWTKGDVSICEKIEDPERCIHDVEGNWDCKELYFNNKEIWGCMNRDDYRLTQNCAQFSNGGQIVNCILNGAGLTKPATFEDICIPEFVSPSIGGDIGCKSGVAIFNDDLTVCDQLVGNEKGLCYIEFAKVSNKVGLAECDNAGAQWSYCYALVAIRNKNPAICEMVAEGTKSTCYHTIAKDIRDMSLCLKAGLDSDQHSCAYFIYDQIPENQKTMQICDEWASVPTAKQTDNCYWTVATNTYDINACNKILHQQTKADCLELLSH